MKDKMLKILKITFLITLSVDVFLLALKHEININKTNYKVLIQNENGEYENYDGITFPKKGYILGSYECDGDGIVNQDDETKALSFSGNTNKCILSFDINKEPSDLTFDKMKALNTNLSINEGTPDFSVSATTDEGIFETEDDYGTSYYFRGNSQNNYVKFANFFWRIVRINGDGSVRLLYTGETASAKSDIGASTYNTNSNNNGYMGYMFGSSTSTYESTHSNVNDSEAKETLDNWYRSYIASGAYKDYVSDTLFCNDRSLASGTGIGTTTTNYGAQNRNQTNKKPSLLCSRQPDRFTVSDTTVGNGALTYPIGMLTADEATMAGAVWLTNNTSDYLVRDNPYWLMSPASYSSGAYMPYINNGTILRKLANSSDIYIVPVINITSDAFDLATGTGTKSDPFIINISNTSPSYLTLRKLQSLNSTIRVNSSTPSFTKVSNTTTNNLFKMGDVYGVSYYFRGKPQNNYLKFGDWYWRIVRINGDGTLRLLYDGTSAGAASTIQDSVWNQVVGGNAYVGYMYGNPSASTYAATHANTNSSTIKNVIDNWYTSNISGKSYESYVADNIFCFDRTVSTGNGIGTNETYYKGYERLYTSHEPTLLCSQKNDAFTVSDTTNGNGALTYPIGLLSGDEMALGGSVWIGQKGGTYSGYLKRSYIYWSGTPAYYSSVSYSSAQIDIQSDGTLYYGLAGRARGVVPVINITSEAVATLTGTGISSDPFVVN